MIRAFCLIFVLQAAGNCFAQIPAIPSDQVVAENQTVPGVVRPNAPSAEIPSIAPDQLQQLMERQKWVPVPLSVAQQIAKHIGKPADADAVVRPNRIREAIYRATLSGSQLTQGQIELTVQPPTEADRPDLLMLGIVNLNDLSMEAEHREVTIASDDDHRLFLLKAGYAQKIIGHWSIDGAVTGDVTTFRMELPEATISRIELTTSSETIVTSPNALVLGPEERSESESAWVLLPNSSSRVTIGCRRKRWTRSGIPLSLMKLTENHVATGDTMISQWSLTLTPELQSTDVLSVTLPDRLHVTDVLLNDNQPMVWDRQSDVSNASTNPPSTEKDSVDGNSVPLTPANPDDDAAMRDSQQQLNIQLPQLASTLSISIQATSALPTSSNWPVPLLKPLQWRRKADGANGAVLMPTSLVRVTLPAGIELDSWRLTGMQELDVNAGQENAVIYQLTRFVNEASAVARISASDASTTETVVSILEQSGRVLTANCLVNVRCEQGIATDLYWDIQPGWDVIGARYASNSRALFFEFDRSGKATASRQLQIHLPEPIESGSSRVVQLSLQQSDLADVTPILQPFVARDKRNRPFSYTLVTPDVVATLPAIEQVKNPSFSLTELTTANGWLAAQTIPARTIVFDDRLNDLSLLKSSARQPSERPAIEVQDLRCRIQVEGEFLKEVTLIRLAPAESDHTVPFLLPAREGAETFRWSVDGKNVDAAQRGDDSGEWRTFMVPVPGGNDNSPGREVTFESTRHLDDVRHAMLAVPLPDAGVSGVLSIDASEQFRILPEALSQAASADSSNEDGALALSEWLLPASPRRIRLVIERSGGSNHRPAFVSHIFHIFDVRDDQVRHQRVAIGQLSESALLNTVRIEEDFATSSKVFIDGRRVAILSPGAESAVPVPSDSAECRIVVIADPVFSVTNGFSRLALKEVSGDPRVDHRCTHHILVSPEMQIRSPDAQWQTSASVDVLGMMSTVAGDLLNRVSGNEVSRGLVSRSGENFSQEVSELYQAVQGFGAEWKLRTEQGWKQRTITSLKSPDEVQSIRLTSLRTKSAIIYGVALFVLTTLYLLRSRLGSVSGLILVLLTVVVTAHWYTTSDVLDGVLLGLFWGLLAGFALSLAAPLFQIRRPVISQVVRTFLFAVVSAACLQNALGAVAQEGGLSPGVSNRSVFKVTEPRIVQLRDGAPAGIAYVENKTYEEWLKRTLQNQVDVVVTGLDVTVDAPSLDDVEATLIIHLATLTDIRDCRFTIDLPNALLVNCQLDGLPVLPAASSQGTVTLLIPAATRVTNMPLTVESDLDSVERSEFAPRDKDRSESRAGDVAGPSGLWDKHELRIRLRPRLASQANGVQFTIPSVSCPAATFQIIDSKESVSRAFIQTHSVTRDWQVGDEAVDLGSLSSGTVKRQGIEVRLFGTAPVSVKAGSEVQTAIVCELSAGQQFVTVFSSVQKWNPLVRKIQLPLPRGYRLVSVACPQVPQVLWSVVDDTAEIQLNELNADTFLLELRYVTESLLQPLQHVVSPGQLSAIVDCQAFAECLIAIRTPREFSVQPLDQVLTGDGQRRISTTASIPAAFSAHLRPTDVLFSVPSMMDSIRFQLTPRVPYNEVRVEQTVECHTDFVDWKYEAFIDTSFVPIFRHQLAVNPSIEVTDVQVFAGEANRLDRYYQKDDRLMVLFKEGTDGPHRIVVRGRQAISSSADIRLIAPQLLNAQILESSMTIEDLDDSGLYFRDLGRAVPDRPLAKDAPLVPETPIRFQVIEEGTAVILGHQQSSAASGELIVVHDQNDATVFVRIQGGQDLIASGELQFPRGQQFAVAPRVFIGRDACRVTQEQRFFRWEASASESEDTDVSELLAFWRVNDDAGQIVNASSEGLGAPFAVAVPELSFAVEWSVTELIELPPDFRASVNSDVVEKNDDPTWMRDIANLAGMSPAVFGLPGKVVGIQDGRISVAAPSAGNGSGSDDSSELNIPIVISDTVAVADRNESVIAETTLLFLSERMPINLSVALPNGVAVVAISNSEGIRKRNSIDGSLDLEISEPITRLSVQWLGSRTEGHLSSTDVDLTPPFPLDCETFSLFSLHYAEPGAECVPMPQRLSRGEFEKRINQIVAMGLERNSAEMTSEDVQRLIETTSADLNSIRQQFFERTTPSVNGTERSPWYFSLNGSSEEDTAVKGLTVRSIDLLDGHTEEADSAFSLRVIIRRLPTVAAMVPYGLILLLTIATVVRSWKSIFVIPVQDYSSAGEVPASSVFVGADNGLAATRIYNQHADPSSTFVASPSEAENVREHKSGSGSSQSATFELGETGEA
ncbi:MAG: hypothetical protein KDA91_01340 [Planctomycetaceae bacterium]|nr:hypothetical protein [Planctomycetaceae bacterium]